MAEATCGTCSGRGGAYELEYDETGRPTGGQVWEPCQTCAGTGIVWVPDAEPAPAQGPEPGPLRASRPQRRRRGRAARLTPERQDRSFRTFLAFVFACLLGWLAFLTPLLKGINPWALLAVGLLLVGLFFWGLTLVPRVIRILRVGFAWVLVLGLGIAFAVGIYLAVR